MLTVHRAQLADPADPTLTRSVDIDIEAGHICAVRPAAGGVPAPSDIDAHGLLVLPGLVNAHAHVDKSWFGHPWQSFGGERTLDGRIQWERARRGELNIPSTEITTNVLRELARFGTTAVRSHIDVDTGIGLAGLEAAHAAFARAAGMKYELIAFPQDGVLRRPGVDLLLRRAAEQGLAQHVGGLDPAGIDRDPVGQLDLIFSLAAEYDTGIDIHLHDEGELGGFQFDLIAERTEKLNRQGKVTIAHGLALGELSPARQRALVDRMAELDITLTTVVPVGSAKLPWQLMRGRVGLGFGTDGIRDLWGPYGDGNLMSILARFARWQGARFDEELVAVLDAATWESARFVGAGGAGGAGSAGGAGGAGIAAGSAADLQLIEAENPMDALVRARAPRWVLASGQVLVRDGEVTF